MKKIIATTLLVLLVFWVMSIKADTWKEFDHKTYLGGYYFTVCEVCLDGNFNNDTTPGLWQCDSAVKKYEKGCAKGIYEAFVGSPEITEY